MACSPRRRGHNVRDVRQADRRSIEFAVDGAEQIAQLEQPDSLGMVSMSAMSAADAMRGGAVILPLFLLRPLDRPLDQLRIFDPTKPPRIVELVAQVDMQAQCLGLCRKRLDKLVQRKPRITVVFAIGILVLPAKDVPDPN
jgi:hypothetical protein